jgi:uncharacterized protein (DUF697 family)
MASIFKLPDIWRVMREVDLESIRQDAEGRFRLVILAETVGEADTLARLLSGDEASHPWIEVRSGEHVDAAGDDAATITAAIAITSTAGFAVDVADSMARLTRAGVPVVTLVVGSRRPVDAVVRAGETARVIAASLEEAVETLGPALAGVVSAGMRLALARQLPPLREAVFDHLIDETAKANATYALTAGMAEQVPILDVPLNIADMLVLTKNQLLMGYKIALGAGKSGRPRDLIGEVLGVVGGGFLFRQAARQLVGLIPVAGLIPKVAIAYTGTWAIGHAVVVWATQGRKLSTRAMGRLSRDAAGRGRAYARGLLGERKRSAAAK